MSRAGRSCFCLDGSKLSRLAPEPLAPWSSVSTFISDLTIPELRQAGILLKPGTLLSNNP